MTGDPFGWGGLHLVPQAPLPEPEPTDLQRIADETEAERFRLELERDARGVGSDWPDGS